MLYSQIIDSVLHLTETEPYKRILAIISYEYLGSMNFSLYLN